MRRAGGPQLTTLVVHAPVPYAGNSAGYRALWELAYQIESRGHSVRLWPLYQPLPERSARAMGPRGPLEVLGADLHEAPCEAIHVYPEGIYDNPAGCPRIARWFLNAPRADYHPLGRPFVWIEELGPYPRLTLDLIEPCFHPKSVPGSGVLWYRGKGRVPFAPLPQWTRITPEWPADRSELADLLRSSDLLISCDGFSMLNLEATLCGTPVKLIGDAPKGLPSQLFAQFGVSADEDEARATVGEAYDHYVAFRQAIQGDVDRFLAVLT